MRLVLSPLLLAAIAFSASAGEIPEYGIVTNAQATRSLMYECSAVQGDTLKCHFTSASLHRKTLPQDLDRKVEEARKEYKDAPMWTGEDCRGFAEQLDMREGRRPIPKGDPSLTWAAVQSRDSVNMLKSFLRMCDAYNIDTYLAYVRVTEEQNTRTCHVKVARFSKVFKRVPGTGGGEAAWVVDGKPGGVCDLADRSRFQSRTLSNGGQSLKTWHYVEKVSVGNPQGKYPDGSSCSVFDNLENVYDVGFRGSYVGCDYVQFDWN